VQQPQSFLQHKRQYILRRCSAAGIGHSRLEPFEIPITKFIPEKPIQRIDRLIKFELLQLSACLLNRSCQPRENPPVGYIQLLNLKCRRFHPFQIHQRKPRGIPQFVAEIAADIKLRRTVHYPPVRQLKLNNRHPNILRLRRHLSQRKPHCIGTMAVNDHQRVDAVAQTFGHLAALAILNHRVNIHIMKRNITDTILPHHHHSGNPQRNNLASCAEHIRRIECLQLSRFLRPAHRTERPQGRTEPGVQHILITHKPRLFQPPFQPLGPPRRTNIIAGLPAFSRPFLNNRLFPIQRRRRIFR